MAAGQHESADNITCSSNTILPDDSDHSLLQQPLNVGVKNVKQILKCIQNGSPEIKDLILNECNIIYECKLCSNLFRSLANFLYHKRVYCRDHLCENMLLFETVEDADVSVQNLSDINIQSDKCEIDDVLVLTEPNVSSETTLSQMSSCEISSRHKVLNKQKSQSKKSHSEFVDDAVSSMEKGIQEECLSESLRVELESKDTVFCSDTETEVENMSSVKLEAPDSGEMILGTSDSLCIVSLASSVVSDVKPTIVCDKTFINFKGSEANSALGPQMLNSVKACTSKTEIGHKPNIIPIVMEPIQGNPNAVVQKIFKDSGDLVSRAEPGTNLTTQGHTDTQEKTNEIAQDDSNNESHCKDKNTVLQNNLSTKSIHMIRKERLLNRKDCDLSQLMCCLCQSKFTTLKMLYVHMMSYHSQARLYYPCPFCKILFIQMYGVTKHLMLAHGKKKEQINNKLRETIRKKAVWKYANDDEINDEEKCNKFDQTDTHKNEVKLIKSDKKEEKIFHSYMKVERSTMLHHCSKCSRVFSRKSSQVSHEKFCIMNSGQKESLPSSQSVPSFKNSSSKLHDSIDNKANTRPKRAAEKQMHKDFVNSQTLKWRSANKIETAARASSFKSSRTHERKIMSVVNVTKLLCLKCDKKFSSFSNLRRHAAIHIGWTRYKCTFCNAYKSYNRSDCKQHLLRVHSVPEDELNKYVKSLLSEVKSKKHCGIDSKLAKNQSLINKNKIQNKLDIPGKNTTIAHAKSMFSGNLDTQFNTTAESVSGAKKIERRKPLRKKTKKLPLKCESTELFRTKNTVNDYKKSVSESKLSGKKKAAEYNKKQNTSTTADDKISPSIEKLQVSYKSSTTSSPTTIILSKTCASSTVQIMKNHAPVAFAASKRINTVTANPSQKKEIDKSASAFCQNMSKPVTKLISYKTAKKPCYADDKNNSEMSCVYPSMAKTLKKNKTINDWLTKNPTPVMATGSLMSRKDTAPLIIGLVPANPSSSSNRP